MVEVVEIFRINGEKANLPAIDANRALKDHRDEWSRQPWSKKVMDEYAAANDPEKQKKLDDDKARADASDALKAAKAAAQAAHSAAEKAGKAFGKATDDNRDELKKALEEAEEAADAADEEVKKLES